MRKFYRSEPNTLCFKSCYILILLGFKPVFTSPIQCPLIAPAPPDYCSLGGDLGVTISAEANANTKIGFQFHFETYLPRYLKTHCSLVSEISARVSLTKSGGTDGTRFSSKYALSSNYLRPILFRLPSHQNNPPRNTLGRSTASSHPAKRNTARSER